MSDERTGRELTPRPDEEPSALTPREPAAPTATPAARFYAGDQAHTVGLTEERAAQIVRQSGNARSIAFLGVLVVVLFIPIYWLFDIGVGFFGFDGRLKAEAERQYVIDVARGHALYLANCARCHGNNGQGGIGPPLNDQGKLYQAVTPQGNPGSGHLNADYLASVLREGGRIVCGDPKSVMPAWEQPKGPLNYREVKEIIAFLVASNEVHWIYDPNVHGEAAGGDETPQPTQAVSGWRDPNYSPPPGSTPAPDCWRATPVPTAGGATPAPIANPGTPENPRVIDINETGSLTITDAGGTLLSQIAVVPGETITFNVTNTAGFDHNFYIGPAARLQANDVTGLPGVPNFTTGTQSFTWTAPTDLAGLQFACTVTGHYNPMHGDIVATTAGGGSPAPSATTSTPVPSQTTVPAPSPSPTPSPAP